MAAQGLILANAGALAAAAVPDHPGTGSAVLGMLQWVAAGTVAPLAGLGGSSTAAPMAVLVMVGGFAALAGQQLIVPAAAADRRPTSDTFFAPQS
jgi:DHA1 family bicyclomycin/chloramphenicol resistance-like MFS transporter